MLQTLLNIDTNVPYPGDDHGLYSPGPASLTSSASSSRRGSFSDSGGGFFQRKISKTFRPESHQLTWAAVTIMTAMVQ